MDFNKSTRIDLNKDLNTVSDKIYSLLCEVERDEQDDIGKF